MADFDKLREAAEEIKLDDLQKKKILEACKGKKRKKINYAAIAAAAAVLIVTVGLFSPGFYLKAGAPADTAENEAGVENYFAADQDVQDSNSLFSNEFYSQNSSASGNGDYKYTIDECTQIIFTAESFRSIYSLIPQSFISLVEYDDFVAWSAIASADNGMAIAQFVEHFGISKEAFDEANRSYAKYIYEFYGISPLYCTSNAENEKYEIFNTELIYSSGREAIDEYYRAFSEFPEDAPHSSPAEMIVPEEYYK